MFKYLTDAYYYGKSNFNQNHIKYANKKKHCPVKIFSYQQNNEASNYDFDSVVK